MRAVGAPTIGWPLVWSVPLLPYRALGLPLGPNLAFAVGLDAFARRERGDARRDGGARPARHRAPARRPRGGRDLCVVAVHLRPRSADIAPGRTGRGSSTPACTSTASRSRPRSSSRPGARARPSADRHGARGRGRAALAGQCGAAVERGDRCRRAGRHGGATRAAAGDRAGRGPRCVSPGRPRVLVEGIHEPACGPRRAAAEAVCSPLRPDRVDRLAALATAGPAPAAPARGDRDAGRLRCVAQVAVVARRRLHRSLLQRLLGHGHPSAFPLRRLAAGPRAVVHRHRRRRQRRNRADTPSRAHSARRRTTAGATATSAATVPSVSQKSTETVAPPNSAMPASTPSSDAVQAGAT